MLAVMGVDPSVGAASFLSLEDKAAYETVCVACREEVRSPFIHRSFEMNEHVIKKVMMRWMFNHGRRHKNLTSLVLTECLISSESLMMIARCCPNLTLLNIEGSNGFTQDALVFAMNHWRRLKSIDMRLCWGVGDQTVEAVAANCKNLTYLKVSHTTGDVTDESIALIAAECPELTELNVSGHHHMTIQSLRAITAYCPKLTFVNFNGVARWRDIEAVLSAYPNIKTYNTTTFRFT
jgi:hypothetical protein